MRTLRVAFDLKGKKLLATLLALSCGIVILNKLYINSIALGLISSAVFFSSFAIVCGSLLFHEGSLILRLFNGFFSAFVVLIVIGTLALYIDAFNPYISSLIVIFVTAFALLIFISRKSSGFHMMGRMRPNLHFPKMTAPIFLGAIWAVFICASFYILITSRTDEPMFSVWNTIPVTSFLLLSFLSTFILTSLVFLRRGFSSLLLILFQSILFESLYYLVWFPSLYGDPLEHLGKARFVDRTGTIYAKQSSVSRGDWLGVFMYNGYSVFVVFLTRFLNFDVYWVHNVSIPIFWAIILPLSAYEITCLLIGKHSGEYPREALLAAFSAAFLAGRLLITWGANPTPNTFSFMLLFFLVPILLRWFLKNSRSSLFLAIIVMISAFMVHPLPGTIAVIFLLVTIILKKVKIIPLKALALIGAFTLYPAVLVFGLGASFLPLNLISISNFLKFQNNIDIMTIPLLVAIIGFFICLRNKNSYSRSIASLLTLFYVFVILEYYAQFGINPMPYGVRRMLPISYFLLAPFLAIGLNSLFELIGKVPKLRQNSVGSKLASIKSSFNLRASVALGFCVLISLQSVLTLYQAYPEHEVEIAPTRYEMDAIFYLNSTAPRRFVVIGDPAIANLATGMLGVDYSYGASGGVFGLADWHYPIQEFYLQMVNQPSMDIFKEALKFARATVAYFVVSERLSNFGEVVQEMSSMLPVDKVFGDGKLYIFKYPMPINKGPGPRVTVIYEDGKIDNVESNFEYMIKTEVKYSLVLSNHTSYNITNYPKHWVFGALTINGEQAVFDDFSDVNDFILKGGLNPADVLEVVWSANDVYPACGWKEDSFKKGWGPYPKYTYLIEPTIFTDGNTLALSGNFEIGRYMDYYFAKPAEISTEEYQYVILRWKSDGPVAVVYVYFEEGGQAIVPFGSSSADWMITKVKLDPGRKLLYIMVGISNVRNQEIYGIQTMYVDYILICSERI